MSEAETALREALAAKPQSMEFQLGAAALLVRQGDLAKAQTSYESTLANHPHSPIAHKSFGDFLALAGRHAEAEQHHAKAIELKPTDASFRRAYATTLHKLGKPNDAIGQLEEAATLGLASSETAAELAELYSVLGQSAKAVNWYEKAIALDPKSVSALNNLAWILATDPDDEVRNGLRAVDLAERACEMTEWKAAVLMGTLGAAYAEAGRFPDAVTMAGKARDRARADQQETIANKNDELRKLYERRKPFRDN